MIMHMLKTMKTKNSHISETYTERNNTFEAELDALRHTASYLLNLVRKADALKNQLDLRDDMFTIEPQKVAREHTLSIPKNSVPNLASMLVDYSKRFLPLKYDITDALVGVGYNQDAVKTDFSSTKLWIQLLV